MADDELPTPDSSAVVSEAAQAATLLLELGTLVESAKGRVVELDAQISSALSTITSSMGTAKSSLSEIDAAKTAIATIRGGIEEIQKSTISDGAAITQAKADTDKLKVDAEALSKKVADDADEVGKKIAALNEQLVPLRSLLDEMNLLKVDANANGEAVANDAKRVAESKATFDVLGAQTQATHDSLLEKQAAVAAQLTEVGNARDAIKAYFGTLLEDADGKPSIRTEIEERRTNIEDVLANVKSLSQQATTELGTIREKAVGDLGEVKATEIKRFDNLYEELKNKVLSLLPSAGAAGLSSTYYDAKSKYAHTAPKPRDANDTRKIGWWSKLVGYNPESLLATIMFYVLFLGPLAIIVYIFWDVLRDMARQNPSTYSYKFILVKTLLSVPLATISGFGFSSLRLYRRLYEEYNYKQRVMELYQSFSREVEAHGDDEQKKVLLGIMMKAVSDKPSLTMHRYDGSADGPIRFDIMDLINRYFSPAPK